MVRAEHIGQIRPHCPPYPTVSPVLFGLRVIVRCRSLSVADITEEFQCDPTEISGLPCVGEKSVPYVVSHAPRNV